MDVVTCDSSSECEMPPAKVRGGIHQRKRRRTNRNVDTAPVAVPTSKTGIYLQQKFAWVNLARKKFNGWLR